MSISDEAENSAKIKALMTAPPVTRSKHSKMLQAVRNMSVVVAFVALALAVVAVNRQASINHDIAVSACRQDNVAKARNAQLWKYIIDLNRKANLNPTAKQAATLAAFEAEVKRTYAPLDCTRLNQQ